MRKYLIPYLTAGFPEKAWFASLVKTLDRGGADYIEIGVPFSDPIADGPVIQAASQRALDNGVTVRWMLEQVRTLRLELRAKLIFFSYYNPLNALAPTLEEAARILADTGFQAVLIPDLALEEADRLVAALRKAGLHYIPLIAPTTTEQRLVHIAPLTTDFAYGVSVAGVTGVRQGVAAGLDVYLQGVRRYFKEFVVGFGVSTPEDAARISRIADGIVIGSAIIKLLGECPDEATANQRLGAYMASIRKALDNPPT